jgi:opacity protein-like surface antigen
MACLAALFMADQGFAADHYVSGSIGMSWMNDVPMSVLMDEDYTAEIGVDSGISLLGAIGCDYGSYRLEAEIGYQKNDINDLTTPDTEQLSLVAGATEPAQGDVSVVSLMANGYYDIDAGGFEPYITAGIGIAQVSLDDFGPEGDDTGMTLHETTLAYQIGAGFAIPIGGNVMLDARYRYFATTDFTMYYYNMDVSSHSALLGLRVGF